MIREYDVTYYRKGRFYTYKRRVSVKTGRIVRKLSKNDKNNIFHLYDKVHMPKKYICKFFGIGDRRLRKLLESNNDYIDHTRRDYLNKVDLELIKRDEDENVYHENIMNIVIPKMIGRNYSIRRICYITQYSRKLVLSVFNKKDVNTTRKLSDTYMRILQNNLLN